MEIKEDLLHHIWKFRLFKTPLLDLDDLPIELVDPGQHNHDSGPDFFNARIRSEGIQWAGNVEIHKKASEWYQHGHHLDPAFDNVILHVVLDPDCQVFNSCGRAIRTVRLEIPPETRLPCLDLMGNQELILPWQELTRKDPGCMHQSLERLLLERYENRFVRIMEELKRCEGDWEELLYRLLARAFGQRINTGPFDMLSRSVPMKKILRYCPGQITKEAILFGQAGMLGPDAPGTRPGEPKTKSSEPETAEDAYYFELCQRYRFLMHKLHLQPIDGFLWKFLRLRPVNFPTIRISQFASSLEQYEGLFRQLPGDTDPLDLLIKMEFRASEYWSTHYRFFRSSPPQIKSIGRDRMAGLFMNAILPFLHASARMRGVPALKPDIPGILARIPPEDNRIIRTWRSLGIVVPDGFTSQALLQLSNKYCIFKRSLSCYEGNQIIQSSPEKK